MRQSRRPPDEIHPFGYGRESYFWSFVVALLIFSGGAGVSIYEGIVHIREPEPMTNPLVNFIVLGLAFLFEGTSWVIALREFARTKGKLGWWQAMRASKDPSTLRSEEHTSELQSLMRISYAVFCLKKKKTTQSQSHQ